METVLDSKEGNDVDALVKLVAQKTGLDESIARKAVETVIGYLMERLPAPLAAQVEGVLKGSDVTKTGNDLLKGVGGLLGSR